MKMLVLFGCLAMSGALPMLEQEDGGQKNQELGDVGQQGQEHRGQEQQGQEQRVQELGEGSQEGGEGRLEEYSPLYRSQEVVESKGKRFFEEFFHKKTQDERRRRMEELKEMNQNQERRRREQRRRKKQQQKEGRGAGVRRSRDVPRIDCRVRSPAHVVNLLLLIHNHKVRDQVAGAWLRECSHGGRASFRNRPSTALRYFG